MAQLTLEKAKELLKKLQYAKAQMGQLSLNDEMYKQALEIAIPALEQQQRGEAEWIDWGGGECPVGSDIVVEYKTRLGNIHSNKVCDLRWIHEGKGGDIIAYRQQSVKPKRGGGF